MSYLYNVSAVLLALKLGAVSGVSWELIILPAALQGTYKIVRTYQQWRELQKLMKSIQDKAEK